MSHASHADAAHRGLLVTFEGPEGSGKTTLIQSLEAELTRHGCEPLLVREPGGTAIGERIRAILLDLGSRDMCAETELLLMEASRAQLVREKIEPALEAGPEPATAGAQGAEPPAPVPLAA